MKNITVVNFNGVKYSGVWNEKTYKSNVEGHPEYLRIYVDNEVCHITPSEYEKLGGNIQLEEHKRKVENYKSQTEYKLRKLVELLDDPAVSFFLKKNGISLQTTYDIKLAIKDNVVTVPSNL